MNLLHLQYFHVVAREGGFTKASRRLRIQQPAISRMVKQLEEAVGGALFERIGREVRLTPLGRETYARSQRIFGEVENLERFLAEREAEPSGALAFAAADVIASADLPARLAKLRERAPLVIPQIFAGPASYLFDRILNGELEFGLFFHIPSLPERLKVSVVRRVRFYLVAKRESAKDPAVLESFIGSREIDDASTRTFPTLAKLKRLVPRASIKISTNSLAAHRELVLRGLGVAVLPDFVVGEDLRAKHVVDLLPRERLEFDLKLVQRESGGLSLNARTFLECCAK